MFLSLELLFLLEFDRIGIFVGLHQTAIAEIVRFRILTSRTSNALEGFQAWLLTVGLSVILRYISYELGIVVTNAPVFTTTVPQFLVGVHFRVIKDGLLVLGGRYIGA